MTTKIKSIAILLRLLIIYIYTNFIKIKIYHFSLQKLKKILNYLLNFFLFSLKILYINIYLINTMNFIYIIYNNLIRFKSI